MNIVRWPAKLVRKRKHGVVDWRPAGLMLPLHCVPVILAGQGTFTSSWALTDQVRGAGWAEVQINTTNGKRKRPPPKNQFSPKKISRAHRSREVQSQVSKFKLIWKENRRGCSFSHRSPCGKLASVLSKVLLVPTSNFDQKLVIDYRNLW